MPLRVTFLENFYTLCHFLVPLAIIERIITFSLLSVYVPLYSPLTMKPCREKAADDEPRRFHVERQERLPVYY